VQEIRLSQSKTFVGQKARVAIGNAEIVKLKNLAVVKTDELMKLADAQHMGTACVLIAEQHADGSFAVKKLLRSSGVVNAALAALYSADSKTLVDKQAEQQAQDPLVQMQQQELQLKAQEVQIKAEKTKADIASDQVRLQIEQMRIESQERIAGAQLGAKAAMDKEKLDATQLAEGTRIGIEAVQKSSQLEVERERIAQQDRASNRNKQQPTGE
jgi:hypothetical protein